MGIERTPGLILASTLGDDHFVHVMASGKDDWIVRINRPKAGAIKPFETTMLLTKAEAAALAELLTKAEGA